MALTYREKLKIFHDTFVKYSWNCIERQKSIELGQELPMEVTPFGKYITTIRITPIVEDNFDIEFWINQLWSSRLSLCIDKISKQALSEAIHNIAANVESKLTELQDIQAIGRFATEAVVKLITYLKNLEPTKSNEITSKDIIEAVLL